MVEDDRGAFVGDHRHGRELADHGAPQPRDVGHGDVHEGVLDTGQEVHGEGLGPRPDLVEEAVDRRAVADGELHEDHRLEMAPERGEIDLGPIAADHPCALEIGDAGRGARRRQSHPLSKRPVRDPSVRLERPEEFGLHTVQHVVRPPTVIRSATADRSTHSPNFVRRRAKSIGIIRHHPASADGCATVVTLVTHPGASDDRRRTPPVPDQRPLHG